MSLNQAARNSGNQRRLTPHAGPRDPFGQPTGFHAPSLDDAPVLLACLDDDPDRLCVLGGYYDPATDEPTVFGP